MQPLDDHDDEGEDNDGHYQGQSVNDDNNGTAVTTTAKTSPPSPQIPRLQPPVASAPGGSHFRRLEPIVRLNEPRRLDLAAPIEWSSAQTCVRNETDKREGLRRAHHQ